MTEPFLLAAMGGALIGMSAVLLMALTGRIAGISGIVAGLLPPKPMRDKSWRLAFVAGLLLAPLGLRVLTGFDGIGAPVVSVAVLIPAGLLVGIGAVLGSGCTSGHGICGLARLSTRSFAAVAIFMAAAVATVFVTHHML